MTYGDVLATLGPRLYPKNEIQIISRPCLVRISRMGLAWTNALQPRIALSRVLSASFFSFRMKGTFMKNSMVYPRSFRGRETLLKNAMVFQLGVNPLMKELGDRASRKGSCTSRGLDHSLEKELVSEEWGATLPCWIINKHLSACWELRPLSVFDCETSSSSSAWFRYIKCSKYALDLFVWDGMPRREKCNWICYEYEGQRM